MLLRSTLFISSCSARPSIRMLRQRNVVAQVTAFMNFPKGTGYLQWIREVPMSLQLLSFNRSPPTLSFAVIGKEVHAHTNIGKAMNWFQSSKQLMVYLPLGVQLIMARPKALLPYYEIRFIRKI